MDKIVRGKITKITGFGAFVAVEGGASGLIHISEISREFVKDINAFLSEGQEVEAAVISQDENGRLSLSLKRLPAPQPQSGAAVPPDDYFRKPKSDDSSLEGMLSRFRSVSDDKMGDLKKGYDGKRGKTVKKTKH